jgi:hypothetical protein
VFLPASHVVGHAYNRRKWIMETPLATFGDPVWDGFVAALYEWHASGEEESPGRYMAAAQAACEDLERQAYDSL